MSKIKTFLAGLFSIAFIIGFAIIYNPNAETKKENTINRQDFYSLVNQIKVLDSTKASLQEKLYYELAKEAGRRDTLDWKIPYSIWMVESKMDPNAKGDGGKAFSLGQVHLPTAKGINPKLTADSLMNPIINGFTSCSVLKDYTNIFHGNILYGIAAYQAGPVAIKEDYKNNKPPRNWQYVNKVFEFWSKLKDN